jgi:AICAR transformylase/IMP cyclohydrolase PurH
LLWQAVNPNQRNSAADPQQIPLENKVLNKIIAPKVTNDAATILSKKEVPILCYHNIILMQCWPMTKVYTVKPTDFAAQMKALGSIIILPAQF